MPQQIELRNIALQAAQPLVHGVSLTLQRGRVLALVGGSGSGKSLTCAATRGKFWPMENRFLPAPCAASKLPPSCRTRAVPLIRCTPCTPTRVKPAWRWGNPPMTLRLPLP